MKVKSVKLSEIFPYYDNPRDNTNAVEPTKESIKRFDSLSLSLLIRQV